MGTKLLGLLVVLLLAMSYAWFSAYEAANVATAAAPGMVLENGAAVVILLVNPAAAFGLMSLLPRVRVADTWMLRAVRASVKVVTMYSSSRSSSADCDRLPTCPSTG